MRELLSETGSIYVHIDWHVGHYVKLIMDDIFGKQNFINEIIRGLKPGSRPKNGFGRKHETILFYSKNLQNNYFNVDNIGVSYSKDTLNRLNYDGAREKNVDKVKSRKKNTYGCLG